MILCDDRDPLWINNLIRKLIQDKNDAYRHFESSNNSQQFQNFQSLQNLLEISIKASKQVLF